MAIHVGRYRIAGGGGIPNGFRWFRALQFVPGQFVTRQFI